MAEAVQHPPQHCRHRAGKHTRPVSGAARCLALALALALPLAFTGTANAATIYWDGNDTTADADGGTGTWDTTATNWDDAATAGNPVSWNNATPDIAIFGGTAGTVTLGTAITADSLQFDTASYIVTGNTLTLSGTSTVTANQDAEIQSVVAGTSGLTKAGTGTLNLSGVNTYTGNTTISAGTLEIGSAGQLGSGTYAGAISNSGTFKYNSTANQTLSGVISGSGALIKDNTGTLTLSGTNTYNGVTTVNAGRLVAGSTSAFGSNSAVTVASGAFLELDGNNNSIGSLAGAGTVENANATAATLTTGGDNTSTTFSGVLQDGTGGGALSLTKTGTGTATLSGTNTYTGGTRIEAGTVEIQNSAALGTGLVNLVDTGTQVLDFGANGLTLANNVQISNQAGTKTIRLDSGGAGHTGTLSGQLDIRRSVAGEFVVDVGTDDTLTVSNAIVTTSGGGAGLTKEGAGTLQIRVQSSYAGLTTVNGGTLVIDNPTGTAANFGAGNININNGATLQTTSTGGGQTRLQNKTITFDANGGGTINFGGPNTRIGGSAIVTTGGSTNYVTGTLMDLSGQITFNVADGTDAVDLQVANSINRSGINKLGAGTLRLTNTANNLSTNPIDINAGVVELGGAGRLVAGNYSGNITNDGIFRHNSTNNQTLNGVISGTGAIEKDNNSTLTLTGANTYTGTTTVTNGILALNNTTTSNTTIAGDANIATFDVTIAGGTLRNDANEQIANDASITMSSGAFSLNGATETIENFTNSGGTFTTGAGTLIGLGNTITWSGGTNTINDGGTVQDTHWDVSGGTNTVEGGATGGTLHVQSGGTGFEFTGSGAPTITLNSDNASAGRMLLEGNLTVADTITGTATISSGLALANDGFIDMNGGTRTFTVNDATTPEIDLEISALVTNGGLTKEGTGTMRLTNDNTYDGTTIINAGTLLVNGDQSTAIGDVTINSGGTLGGTGTIGGATLLNSGGSLSAGDGGIGTLSFQEGGAGSPLNSLDISNASTGSLLFDLGASGNGDLVFVEGQLSIGDGRLDMSHFTFTNLGATSVGGTYTWNLFQIDSTNGSFDFTTLGADTTSTPFASIKSASLAISGNLVQLTMTVPEPSSLSLLGLGGLALALRRRRADS